jgi:Ca2+-binding RTX toxin-like protein
VPSFSINVTSNLAQILNGTEGGLLGSQGALMVFPTAITMNGNNDIIIDGTIQTFQRAIDAENAAELELIVGQNGNILSAGDGVFADVTSGTFILNNGVISANGDALTLRADSAAIAPPGTPVGTQFLPISHDLANHGIISSARTAVLLVSANLGVTELTNAGEISGALYGIDNTGTVDGLTILHNTGTLIGQDGAYSGGAGGDYIYNTGTISGTVTLGGGNDRLISDAGVVEGDILGGGGNDTLRAGDDDNNIQGNAGNDILWGRGGDDTMNGGNDNDTVMGGQGNDSLSGGTGVDFVSGGGGDDTITGGDGSDTLVGGDGNDSLLGNLNTDFMSGGRGDDSLDGGNSNDTLSGGEGNDRLLGALGNDSLLAGTGNDTVIGGEGADTMSGGDGDDLMSGELGNDRMFGGLGNDTMNGGDSADEMFGNDGRDILNGSNGADTISGGWGMDTLIGGADADVFHFVVDSSDDVIRDFQNGTDRIDLSEFNLAGFGALAGAISPLNGGSLIDLDVIGGTGSIWVENTVVGLLDATDFIF